MLPNQRLIDNNGKQVSLFPLSAFYISQPWWGTYSHQGGATYYATDIIPTTSTGSRLYREPCYAPVDIELLWVDTIECCALWQSVNQVHFADDTIDYLGIIVYHDNDIANGTYSSVGTVKTQGQIFNRSGTGGNVSGDHVHLETGKGQVNLNQYKYHFRDDTDCRRIKLDNALFINDTIVIPDSYNYYQGYNFKEFQGGIVPPEPTPSYGFQRKEFPWVLYANKIRNRNLK